MVRSVLGAIVALSFSSVAVAQEGQPAPAAPAETKRYVEAAGPVFTQPAPTKSKIICRRDVEIGSLVKGVRRCGTSAQWRASAKAAQSELLKLQESFGPMGRD